MIKAVDLRKGRAVVYEGDIYTVHESQHVAKGNKRSYMQTKLKNIKSGVMREVRFTVDERLEIPFIESKEYEYLYQDASGYVLMESVTFEQITINGELFGDAVKFLTENQKITLTQCGEQMISAELPFVVELTVTDTTPAIKGATATNQLKEAILDSGAKIRVPPFVENGERVRVDTRTGEYMDRAK